MIFSIKPQIFELKCVFSYFRLKTHITLLLPVYVHSWEQRKVREVTDRYDNLRIPVAASLRVAGTTPYYGANGIQDYVDGYTHDGEFILVAEDGANDLKNYPVKCVKGRIWVNNHAHVLQGKYDCADNQFLAYAISQADIESLLVGGGRAKLNAETLMGIDLLLPNKAEQIRIGKYLAQLDNLITLHQCKCQIDGCRFQSPLAITWEQRKLGDLVISHNAGIYISKEDYGTGTNVIGVGNIYDNDIFDGEIYRLGPVNDEKFLLEENDLIYGESSLVPEGIARTVCVGKNGVGSAFAWHTRRVKLDQSVINSHFATLELNYNIDVRKYLISVSTQTALTGMTTEGYFGVTLSLPTVEEQAHISSLFKQLDHLITLHQRKPVVVNSSSTMNALPNQHLYFQVLE